MIFSLKLATLLLICSSITVFAQTPSVPDAPVPEPKPDIFVPPVSPINAPIPIQNIYAFGGSYNFNTSPKFSGTALYGHLVVSPGTYFFTLVDVVPTTTKPYTVTNNVGVGLAQKMFSIGRVDLVIPTTAGVSWTGLNVGWQWNGGFAFVIHLNHNLYLIPTARYLRSNVSNNSGTQPIIGMEFGFGK